MGYGTIGLSKLSTQYILIPVQAQVNGSAYNPTSDTVQFAFMPQATQTPGNSDWVAGSWQSNPSNILFPYSARCLIGPGGTISLGVGTYVIYVKVTDSPEVPVLTTGYLQIS